MEKENVMKWEDLRNQAAIAAMQAVIINNEFLLSAMDVSRRMGIPSGKAVAEAAVEMADALIKELKRSSADEVAGNRNKECAMKDTNVLIQEASEKAYTEGMRVERKHWLEKQGESDETKAKMFLINKGYPIDANGTFPTYEELYDIIREGLENQYEVSAGGSLSVNGKPFDYEKATITQKDFAPKEEPKFKVGDVMRTIQEAANGMVDGMPVIISIDKEYYHCTNELIAIKDQDDYEYPPMNREPAWSEEDEKQLDIAMESCQFLNKIETTNWLKSLKNRVQSKRIWSEEDDERLVNTTISFLNDYADKGYENAVECIDWLKSLKERLGGK